MIDKLNCVIEEFLRDAPGPKAKKDQTVGDPLLHPFICFVYRVLHKFLRDNSTAKYNIKF